MLYLIFVRLTGWMALLGKGGPSDSRLLTRLLPKPLRLSQLHNAGHAAALAPAADLLALDLSSKTGGPPIDVKLAVLIEQMARENPGWGLPAHPG